MKVIKSIMEWLEDKVTDVMALFYQAEAEEELLEYEVGGACFYDVATGRRECE